MEMEVEEEGRNWEDLNADCLVNVLERVGLESLMFDVPFVCKSWYRSSLYPECWRRLRFPGRVWDIDEPSPFGFNQFSQRFINEYQLEHFSVRGFVKLAVSRSRRSAVSVWLPCDCTSEILEFVSNECPALKAMGMPQSVLQLHRKVIPELVGKWKDLQRLHLGSTHFSFKEILIHVSLNCKNFNGLSVRGKVGNYEASAIATLLPNIKNLWLREGTLVTRESLQIILEGCRDLVLLDARSCFGFEAEDEVILKMASHIKTFMVEGSCIGDHPEHYDAFGYMEFCIHDDDDWFSI
ncbi:F-box/LRR-repeat protein At3g48880-like [Macadamia integrifolia]|uniref:F-box/LRR-repeat protein At3g48880-like n=1 Tax=Macadamia integrifolia TaxID=60698 RepID=UPI001C4F9B05|nr:F-box/LRR-repeat protein At3g48880-like [Macadamia integrifolia]